MASVILYGDKIHIKNNYNNGNGGYLDTNGHATAQGAKYNVYTAASPNRAPGTGTGTWQILSTSGKAIGTEVYSGDTVFLFNLYQNNGGISALMVMRRHLNSIMFIRRIKLHVQLIL